MSLVSGGKSSDGMVVRIREVQGNTESSWAVTDVVKLTYRLTGCVESKWIKNSSWIDAIIGKRRSRPILQLSRYL
jgi:hypothetical protein